MTKLSFDDLVSSMSMFFLNEKIDEKYMTLRNRKISTLAQEMSAINHRAGLEKYIRDYKDSIDNLLVVLGISGEYFKRIISMLRINHGMSFRTEWTISKFRSYILTDPEMMDKTLELFIDADSSKYFSNLIPSYRLSTFRITPAVMGRLCNSDTLQLLFSKDLETGYNNSMSASKVASIEEALQSICRAKDLTLKKSVTVDVNGNGTVTIPVNYTITRRNQKLPAYYISYSFQLTTSKGQSATRNNVQKLRDFIITQNESAKQIFILDGAGWIGRQSDMQRIWDYSSFCLNLSHIEELNNLIH